MKQRSNDTDYPFRAHSAFAHLTGWGSDSEPGAVLVFEPDRRRPRGHRCTSASAPAATPRSSTRTPRSASSGSAPRPSLAHVAADLGLATRGLDEFDHVVDAVDTATLVLREADASVTERVDHARIRFAAEQALSTNAADAPFSIEVGVDHEPDAELARFVSELRLVKDEYEIAQMRSAVEATERGFDDVIADLPRITRARAASASSRASSPRARASTATTSATTRSPRPARTHRTCTGPATTAPWCPAT